MRFAAQHLDNMPHALKHTAPRPPSPTGPHQPRDLGRRRRQLLIVASDEALRQRIAEGAQRIPDATIAIAPKLAIAHEWIERNPPDLILSSLSLPDSEGLSLFASLTAVEIPTTFMSHCLRSFREHLGHALRSDDPREAIQRHTQCDCGVRRPLVLNLADSIALAAISKEAILIELIRKDQTLGTILVADGTIRQARDSEGDGLDALTRLLHASGVLITCRKASPGFKDHALSPDWRSFLLENAPAAWLDDLAPVASGAERNPAGLVLVPLCEGRDPQVDEGSSFDSLVDRGLDAILDRRLNDAKIFFEQAQRIKPNDARVAANLARLADLDTSKKPPGKSD